MKLLGKIMTTSYPMNFLASNLKIIDYKNLNSGFLFQTEWAYEGASTVGEIVFENLSFDEESDILDKLKTGSFIESSSPANFTIRDSFFKMHHR